MDTTHNLVSVEMDDNVATIQLNRPEARNALSIPLVEDLQTVVSEVETADVRAAVLCGAGGTFCAGGDLEQPPDAFVEEVKLTNEVIVQMRRSHIPFVAAIEGAAVGGGFELALACDLRVAGREAQMGLPEVTLGIFPCAGGTRLLAQEVGASRARQLVLRGDLIDAEEAKSWGLLDRISASGAVIDTAINVATDLAANSPVGMEVAKRSIADTFDRSLADGLDWDVELARRVAHAADFEEGADAFLEGRDPDFPGR